MSKIDWTELRKRLLLESSESFLPAGWKLPIFPQAVTQFLQHANRPNYSTKKLAKFLEADSNLTCELLKSVNSSANGLRHKAKTALQALVSLGIRRSKMLLLTAAVQSTLKKFNSHLFDLHRFSVDNLDRAMFAKAVAEKNGADAELAFTGAMLQDFLLPVLGHLCLREYVEYFNNSGGVPVDLTEFENGLFGVHHAQAAAACLLQWNVPDELICGVLCHHMTYPQLQELGLIGTHVHAIAASAILPGTIPQYKNPAVQLAQWDQLDDSFDLSELAEQIDTELSSDGYYGTDRESLASRVELCLSQHLNAEMTACSLINRQLGHFILEEIIGEGTMGAVYRARHTMLSRLAAVKVLKTQEHSDEAISRFEREVQLTSQLKHPNTISIYDYGRTNDGLFYYAMEYLEGMSLKELVTIDGPQPAGRVIDILICVCGSLAEAHHAGIVHRDIKPENIVISRQINQQDLVTLLDFGLVDEITDTTSEKQSKREIAGTPLYLAPEAINQPALRDLRSDLYSIGAVGYYLLCGKTLYTGNDAIDICLKQIGEQPVKPSERLKRAISPDLEAIIMQCLHKSPEQRPASASALKNALQQCIDYDSWTPEDSSYWWEHYNDLGAEQETVKIDSYDDATVILPA